MILPQGCSELLYTMAKSNCSNVFPNFDARFQYPGKINQILLFQKTNTPHPKTETFLAVSTFEEIYGRVPEASRFAFPIVFKFDWGGEGDMVYHVLSVEELNHLLKKAEKFEETGQFGFLVQEAIFSKGRSLRINVIGQRFFSFWRVLDNENGFQSNLSKGATIDYDSFPKIQEAAIKSISDFCQKTGINLAGFDILFSFNNSGQPEKTPFFLEINYFFGRRGFGGSEKFYEILVPEINKWLKGLGLFVRA
ncbi:MAG: glutathione synthase [Desulfobacterales bacterium]|nr:glutathione synthase [Desulfobacterales bacterium]